MREENEGRKAVRKGRRWGEEEKKGQKDKRPTRELASRATGRVSRIEAGKRLKPNVLYLKGIAETLGLSLVKLMKLAGYDDVDINWGKDLSNKRSVTDYQEQIKSYEQFYFDVLEEFEKRRKNDFAIKGGIADLIDKLELAKIENKEIQKVIFL